MTTKDIITLIEFMKNKTYNQKAFAKGLGTTKVVFLLSPLPPNIGFSKEKHVFIIKTRFFLACWQISSSALDRTQCARVRAGLQGPCGVALNDGARVLADVDMRLITPLGLEHSALDHSTCALDRTARELLHHFAYFSSFNHILMSVTCRTLKNQKLTKTLEEDTPMGLTNIS